MSTYTQKIFKAFLEKQPKYELPTSPSGALRELDDLKPILSSVELHRHGNELAVVVEGSNLWFSYQIALHDTQKIDIHGHESNGTAIKYHLNGNDESEIIVVDEKVKVYLLTHFSSKTVKQYVSVHKKVRIIVIPSFLYTSYSASNLAAAKSICITYSDLCMYFHKIIGLHPLC